MSLNRTFRIAVCRRDRGRPRHRRDHPRVGRVRPTAPRPRSRPSSSCNGAWSDSASWSGVIKRLRTDGYPVVAPPTALRSLSDDSAYLASYLKTISGPIVLVGHSYGGSVITNAATGNPNVKALVYISAFAPDKGESAAELTAKFPGTHITTTPTRRFPPPSAPSPSPWPTAPPASTSTPRPTSTGTCS